MTQLDSVAWTFVDDDGTGKTGTAHNATKWAALKSSIEDLIHNATYPTVTPEDIIAELIAARGDMASLDDRLDVSLKETGELKTPASLVTVTQLQSAIGSKNLFPDSLCMIWPDGDAAAPASWALTGTGATVARCGVGLGDTTQLKYGDFCIKLTSSGAAAAKLTKPIVSAAAMPAGLKGRKVSVMVKCKASLASQASIVVDDGIGQTRGGFTGNGTYHTGDGNEQKLYCTHTMSVSATKLDIYLETATSGNAWFGCIALVLGDAVPEDWFPERWGWMIVHQQQRGSAAVAADINEFRHDFEMPCLLYKTRLKCKTAPVTTAIIVDVNKDGTTAYTTKPEIAAAATTGSARPDGTYDNRCFKQGSILTWDVDQIGTGTVGEEINAEMIFYVPMPEMDMLEV